MPAPRFGLLLGTFVTALALGATEASADKPGHAPGGRPHGFAPGGNDVGPQVEISPAGLTARLGDTVISIVNDWYQANPTVLAGYRALPPGIAMNLARGKPLPPGIARQVLPSGLQAALPPPQAGYGRFIVGDDLVLVELSSGLIADVVNLFAR